MKLINCTFGLHAPLILDILNDAIVTSTALYDYQPRTLAMMENWFKIKQDNNYPIIGLVDDSGAFCGFASYGAWRAFPAYKYSVEHSIYIEKSQRRKGYADTLIQAITQAAQANEMHMLIGAIDASNAASIALHEKHGFSHCGTVREAGYKFERWLDVAFYQKLLATPRNPTGA